MTARDKIKYDLSNSATLNRKTVPDTIEQLLSMAAPNQLDEWANLSDAVKAWKVLQLFEDTDLDYHKSDSLGEFIYNTRMYTIEECVLSRPYCLHYREGFMGDLVVPDGCYNISGMFYDCDMPLGFNLGNNFDTSNVTMMCDLFYGCVLPGGFSLGDKFDTSNVTCMSGMFYDCMIPEGFRLGDKFNTSNVINMEQMFQRCSISNGFSLGDKFNTSNVCRMDKMFAGCKMPIDFRLPSCFDTDHLLSAKDMFKDCILPFEWEDRSDAIAIIEALKEGSNG